MLQTLIVIVIVAVAALFLARRFYNSFNRKRQPACGCGCEGCAPAQKDACSKIDVQ